MMNSMTTMPLAKPPMLDQSSMSDKFISSLASGLTALVTYGERNRYLHQHAHRLSPHPAGTVETLQHRLPGRNLERLVGRLHHAQRARFGTTESVDDDLDDHVALDARLPQQVGIIQRRRR